MGATGQDAAGICIWIWLSDDFSGDDVARESYRVEEKMALRKDWVFVDVEVNLCRLESLRERYSGRAFVGQQPSRC